MASFFSEMMGTMIFMAFGSSVVAGALLPHSKSVNLSWVGLTMAWGMGVIFGVYTATAIGGVGHINPAFTLALALSGLFPWDNVLPMIAGQLLGGFIGAVFTYLIYGNHWRDTDIGELKLAIFAAGPAHPSKFSNVLSEIISTFLLMFLVLVLSVMEFPVSVSPLMTGLLVFAVGLSLGGPTGPAMNPARDLGPRLAFALLPIPDKGSAQWEYAWIPFVGPIIGAIAGAFFFLLIFISPSIIGLAIFAVIGLGLVVLNNWVVERKVAK